MQRIPQGIRLHEGEPVLAMFEGEFYRAKVVSVGTDIQNQEIVTVPIFLIILFSSFKEN